MEPLNLPVRLRPVGPSPLGLDPELGTGITPGMRAVGRAVVREQPDEHAALQRDMLASESAAAAAQRALEVQLGLGLSVPPLIHFIPDY